MAEIRNDLLHAVLDCGCADIGILNETEYDFQEIVEELRAEGIAPTLETITDYVFLYGQRELKDAVEERVNELEESIKDLEELKNCYTSEKWKELYGAEAKEMAVELSLLKTLEPYEDLECYFNYLDTGCYLSQQKKEIYEEYLLDAVEKVEQHMGFSMR